MCGRFTRKDTWETLRRRYGLIDWPRVVLQPRFNIAPQQDAAVVRAPVVGVAGVVGVVGGAEGAMMRWGLVPSWAESPAIGNRQINARAETLRHSRSYRDAFAKRRCLVPTNGFYEWKERGGTLPKQPYWIGRADGEGFALAGLWESWSHGDERLETFTLITTTPNSLLAPLHHRMPVIVMPEDCATWLDPSADTSVLESLLRPHEKTRDFVSYPVSTRVNSPKVDEASLVERVEPFSEGLFGQ